MQQIIYQFYNATISCFHYKTSCKNIFLYPSRTLAKATAERNCSALEVMFLTQTAEELAILVT